MILIILIVRINIYYLMLIIQVSKEKSMHLPNQFIQNVMGILGERGSEWLNGLDRKVESLSQQWQLTNIKIFENLTYNYVAFAYSKLYGSDVVLKICLSDDSYAKEKNALEYYNGNGCVRLRAYNEHHAALLLEAVKPGTPLKSFFPNHDLQAVEIAVHVMKQLHARPIVNAKDSFPSMSEWLTLFDNLKIPGQLKEHVKRARAIAQKLRASQKNEYLLHGDLHHENILHGPDTIWKAIDPKGVIGEQAYEVGAFLHNPAGLLQQSNAKEIIALRLDAFSTLLKIDRQRLVQASYVKVILSACWFVQDSSVSGWHNDLKYVDLFQEVFLEC